MSIAKFTKVESMFRTTLASGISSTATTVTLNAAPGALTEFPQWFVIEPLSSNYEIIYVPADDGSATLTNVVRGINPNEDTDVLSASFCKAHPANVDVILAPMHRHWNELTSVMDGTKGTGTNTIRIGDETAANITIYAQNNDAAKPYFQYNESSSKWLISNDGSSTYDITSGGSGLTAGAGIIITASEIITRLNASGLLVSNLGAGTNELGIATDTALALAGSSGTPSTSNKFVTQADPVFLNPTGAIVMYAGNTAPTSWLLCDGSAVSRATYSALFAVLFPTVGTFTITIAAPGVVTLVAHGLATGDSVVMTTTGALPTGLTAGTRYWVTKIDADSYSLATTLANAQSSTNITTSGSQSGVHTVKLAPVGAGDGSTTFNLPDLKARLPVGKDATDTDFAGLGQIGGAQTVTLTTTELPAHTHTVDVSNGVGANPATVQMGNTGTPAATTTSSSSGTGSAFSILNPYLTINFIIKI